MKNSRIYKFLRNLFKRKPKVSHLKNGTYVFDLKDAKKITSENDSPLHLGTFVVDLKKFKKVEKS